VMIRVVVANNDSFVRRVRAHPDLAPDIQVVGHHGRRPLER
jgi:hypothetical protein